VAEAARRGDRVNAWLFQEEEGERSMYLECNLRFGALNKDNVNGKPGADLDFHAFAVFAYPSTAVLRRQFEKAYLK
jgi:hypothetical protein